MLYVLLLASVLAPGLGQTVPMSEINDWGSGRFAGHFKFPITDLVDGWEATLTFSAPIQQLDQWMGKVVNTSADKKTWVLVDLPHTGIQPSGNTLDITVQGTYQGSSVPSGTGVLKNMGHDTWVPPSAVPDTDGTKYNYNEVLEKSILFYEAQRSGKLPANKRIPWRGDSALNDRGNKGEDLTGGWYDAGDHVKFNFPMAASTTILEWGLLQFKDAYKASGELDHMYDSIRWPLEYLLKCHVAKYEYYVQVGDGSKDHSFWGRPEDMTMDRPAFEITASKPGSDVTGETAAAFAAGYLLFKDKDPTFAAKLLSHAKDLYDFAIKYKAKYSDSVPQAAAYYRSDAYEDELCWGGVWMYLATKNASYLNSAETYYVAGAAWGQSWDEKNTGCMILLYKTTNKTKYKTDIEATYTDWMPGGTIPYTPDGLAFRLQWGANRYASNMAFLAFMAAENGLHPAEYRKWAMSQIHYVLGDAGHSYVVGFGTKPPKQPHHRGSSCPLPPAPCSNFDFQQPGPNPHTLYGAMVGGPDKSGTYVDKRSDYVKNEVACDYNAGFQSAVAGLKSLAMRGLLPPASSRVSSVVG